MNKITTYKEQSEALKNGVHFINKTKRAFDAVVFELTNGTPDCKIIRTLTLKTNGLDRDFDTARCQRLSRRLQALGFKQNWAALGHPQEGLKGTVRMWRAPLTA